MPNLNFAKVQLITNPIYINILYVSNYENFRKSLLLQNILLNSENYCNINSLFVKSHLIILYIENMLTLPGFWFQCKRKICCGF